MSKAVQQGYNQWAATYDTVENKTRDLDSKAVQTVLSQLQLNKVLEAGCGTGKNTAWLVQQATQVAAMDLPEAMLQKARTKIGEAATFVQADITQLWPFERNAFDAVTCNLVLEHVENLQPVFEEAARVLKSGGYLFVCELHPYKQYSGSKARFETEEGTTVLPCYVHHTSDYFAAAAQAGFTCTRLDEWFDDAARDKPRLVSFLFQKRESNL